MKKTVKILCLVLSAVLLLSSCSSPKKASEKIGEFLSAGQYNECRSYIDALGGEERDAVSADACALIINKYKALCEEEKIDFDNIYDISLYSKSFTEECRSLWNIASLFKISKDSENYGDFVYLRFFALMNDMVRYRELFALMKEAEKSGYLDLISEALYNYNENSEAAFDKCLKKASSFDYNRFDPAQYMISDFRTMHGEIAENLRLITAAFASDDTRKISAVADDLKENMTVAVKIADTLKAVYSKEVFIFKALSDGRLYDDFDTGVNPSEREYTPGMRLSLDYIFKTAPTPGGDIPDSTPDGEKTLSKEKAVETVNKAVNKTKAYAKEASVTLAEQRDVQMTDFRAENEIAAAVEIAKAQVNDYLRKTNGKKTESVTFTDGINGEQTLNSFIPPSGKSAALSAPAVSEYTAVQGSGGYAISLKLPAETSEADSPAVNLLSIVNGSPFDNLENASETETYYSPVYITVTINNDGMLSTFGYKINGVSNCIFTEDNGERIFAEFSFSNEFLYEFKY